MARRTSHIKCITFDCVAWEPLVAFWAATLGFADDPEDPNRPGDPAGLIQSSDGSTDLPFIPVTEGKERKNRVHLDLVPEGTTGELEVERLVGLGAGIGWYSPGATERSSSRFRIRANEG